MESLTQLTPQNPNATYTEKLIKQKHDGTEQTRQMTPGNDDTSLPDPQAKNTTNNLQMTTTFR